MVHTRTLFRLLASAALAGAGAPALSASIDWSTGPTFSGPSGHLAILTNGTLVQAVNLTGVNGGTTVVDPGGLNIVFTNGDTPGFNNNWFSAGSAGALDPGWASVISSFEWRGGSNLTDGSFLSGLTVGRSYQVQFFAARSDCCATRTATYGDGEGHLSTPVAHGSYQSVVGTFVAGASTQAIQFFDSSENPILNAYVLRDVTPAVPEPGTWGLLAAGLAVVGARARRRHG